MRDLLFESGHTHFEKLIQIGTDDTEIFQSLQQGNFLVLREIQNTAIEFQEAQFTVNKPFRTGQITGHGPSAGK